MNRCRIALFLLLSSLCLSTGYAQSPASLPAAENTIYEFETSPVDAANPTAAPMQARDGNFYGVTANGGTNGDGTLYQITPAGKFTILYSFTGGDDGGGPYNTPLQASDGNLYGSTNFGGANGSQLTGGTIYQYNIETQTLTTMYTFAHGGVASFGDIIEDGKGTLYGTANLDDPSGNNLGSVWSFNYVTKTFKTLHTFTGADGEDPLGGLVLASDGNLYGTAEFGGPYTDQDPLGYGYGTAFVIAPDGTNFHVFHNFSNGTEGPPDSCWPSSSPIQASDGNLYAFTFSCGPNGANGVFYRITPAGANSTFQLLYAFINPDGTAPLHGKPFLGGDGNFYIAGSTGGANYAGQVMQLTSAGAKQDVYDFTYANSGGFSPQASPFEGADGNLYGITTSGGPNYGGIFYQLLTKLPPAIGITPSSTTLNNGGTVTLTWSANNVYSLNASLCYAFSTDGSWTGAVSPSGTATVTPTATNAKIMYAVTCAGNETATAQIAVGTIPPEITTSILAGGVTRSPYSQKLSAFGGIAPYTWALASGALPDGLALDPASGIISGTPTNPGTFPFAIKLTDSESVPRSVTGNLTITVVHAPLVAPSNALTLTPSTIQLGSSSVFTATISGPAGVPIPTGSVLFSVNGNPLGDPVALVNGVATSPAETPSVTGSYGISASYSGDSNYTPGIVVTSTLAVSAPSAPGIAATPSTIIISGAGATGSTTLSLVGFPAGTTNFQCSGLPLGAQCSFSPLSSSNTVTLKISTLGSGNTTAQLKSTGTGRPLYALVLPGLLTLAGLRRRRLTRIAALFVMLLLLPLTGLLGGCLNSSPKSTIATPSGSSVVTVTATNGSQSAAINLTLVVQAEAQ